MKMRKVLCAFLALICAFSACHTFVPVASATDTNVVYAETSVSLGQGDYGYCYIYLDDMTDLASLTVAVYYDADKVTVIDSYNQVSCSLYDSSNQPGCLQYSYIFSGDGENQKTNLFYFCYKIKEDAGVGRTYFDIVISDAYNTSVESLPISGSRCSFTITQSRPVKKCTIYGSSSVSATVQEEFTLNYSVSDCYIASGALAISYDPELFEFVELTPGGLLSNKLVDVNSSLPGTVYISFVGTEYYYDSSLLQIRFRTIKNVDTTAQIQLSVSDLCDLNLQNIQCSGYTTMVNIVSDPSYTEDAPNMSLTATYNKESNKVTVVVMLDENSHLGAGDFELHFDPARLTYCSAQKGFAANFFNINDKKVAEGVLKFSIISLSDITDAQTVLTVEFDAIRTAEQETATLEITGSGLSDAMTKPITLNFADVRVIISPKPISVNSVGVSGCTADGNVVKVKNPLACKVGYWNENTNQYVWISARANDDGSYSFDAPRDVQGVVVVVTGDLNGDGQLTMDDKTLLDLWLAGKVTLSATQLFAMDVNGNGTVNSADRILLARALMSGNVTIYKPFDWQTSGEN